MKSPPALKPVLQGARPRLLAHRGGAGLAPENTLVAFERGLAAGADGFELDVHLSRDGEVVVCHDDTLERTTNGIGFVRALTAEELARLDAGCKFSDGASFPFRSRGIGVPRLREVLEQFPDVPITIEIKPPHPAVAEAVVEVVRQAGAVDRTIIGSYHASALRAVRAREPRLATSASHRDVLALLIAWRSWLARSHRPPCDLLQVPERSGRTTIVTPAFVAQAHRHGLPVQVWTVDRPEDARGLLEWGVDGLISDRPDLLADVVKEYRQVRSL